MICNSCIEKINNWYEFKEMCLNSQKLLENSLMECQKDCANMIHLDRVDDWQTDIQIKDDPSDSEDSFEENKDGLEEVNR